MVTFQVGRVALISLLVGLAAACSREQEDWRSAEGADSTEAWQRFLDQHPESEFAGQARKRIVQLRSNATSRTPTVSGRSTPTATSSCTTRAENWPRTPASVSKRSRSGRHRAYRHRLPRRPLRSAVRACARCASRRQPCRRRKSQAAEPRLRKLRQPKRFNPRSCRPGAPRRAQRIRARRGGLCRVRQQRLRPKRW